MLYTIFIYRDNLLKYMNDNTSIKYLPPLKNFKIKKKTKP